MACSKEKIPLLNHDHELRQLVAQIDSIEDELRNLKSPKRIIINTTLSTVLAFLSTYGLHAVITCIHLGVAGLTASAVTLALTSPVGFGCAAVMAVVVGGLTLASVYLESRELQGLVQSLQDTLTEYQARIDAKLDETDAKLAIMQQRLTQQEAAHAAQLAAMQQRLMQQEVNHAAQLETLRQETDAKLAAIQRDMEARFQQQAAKANEDFLERMRQQTAEFLKARADMEQENEDTTVELLRQGMERHLATQAQTAEQVTSLVSCPLCSDRSRDTTLGCGHSMCRECASKWLSQKMVCPYCDAPVEDMNKLYLQ